MSRSKLGPLGLCVIALGLMASMASTASAAPEWLILTTSEINKTAIELPASIAGELENIEGILLTKFVGLKLNFSCTKINLASIKIEGGGIANGGTVIFTGCKANMSASCKLHSEGSPIGTVETKELKGKLQSSGEVLIEPKIGGEPFVELSFSGEECPLPLGVFESIGGLLWVKDCESKMGTHLIKHLIVESTVHSHTMWMGKDTAEHLETSFDGSAQVFLSGPHSGLRWGAIFP